MSTFGEAMDWLRNRGVAVDGGQETDSGLWCTDIHDGDGTSPGATDRVTVHYTGWLTNGEKFDSSHDHGGPASFRLNQVIAGWTEGVSSMRPGGKRVLVIPPELGYGRQGAPPDIPPDATLIFEVELLSVG
jgi:FKBP-type peptidyl-prolyl cis-trans isomerase